MKTSPDRFNADDKLPAELPISTIRGICRGISTDVPNDDGEQADHLIATKAATRIASVNLARQITLDDL